MSQGARLLGRHHAALLGCVAAAVGAWAGCGSDATAPPGSSLGGSGGSGNVGGDASAGTGATIDVQVPDALDPETACSVITEQAQSTPLHLYVMLDKSSSMAGNQWDSAELGLTAFVNAPSSAGVSVGLKLFPRPGSSVPACDQQEYAKPDVPFGTLPANAQAIISFMASASPNGLGTPTYPALGGAILKGVELRQNNPGHTAAVLLVTDGEPQGPAASCSGVDPEDWAAIAGLAAAGAAFDPPVLTYVVGLPGVDQSFANQIAQAGGTASAILVSQTNVAKEFEEALAKVRGQALPCEFEMPAQVTSGQYDPDKVNVVLDAGGKITKILQTTDCTAGAGWYYDDPLDPKKILLCPAICSDVKQDYTAKLDILLGCKTETVR
ncbi:MAG: VWA domain-containing protein [Polyangiaceae bacterium]|nr:VWA domain-containing protein [Polyangiaceae bacterium]